LQLVAAPVGQPDYGIGLPNSAVVTIAESSAPPTAQPVVSVTATQPNASEVGPVSGTFQVARTGSTDSALTVYYGLGGTAVNGADYQMLPGSVTIAAGSATADITVTPIADSDSPPEVTDIVILHLVAAPAGQPAYDIGSPNTVAITITESPAPPPANNQPPVVRIINPRNGARFNAPANIMLLAQASDPDGTVASVEFFAGTTSLGNGVLIRNDDGETNGENEGEDHASRQASRSFYVLAWRRIPAGSYSLTAKATDNQGANTTSTAVNITVQTRVRHHHGDD
jgi:hypothetical protein